MNKIIILKLFLLIFCVINSVMIFSQKVEVKNGNINILSEEIIFNVVFNDSNAIIIGRNRTAKEYYTAKGTTHYYDFVAALDNAHSHFVTFFNTKKRAKIKSQIDQSQNCLYTLYIDVTSMYVGNGLGGTTETGGVSLNGKITLLDNSTKNIICECIFSDIQGEKAGRFRIRSIYAYEFLAEMLIKEISLPYYKVFYLR